MKRLSSSTWVLLVGLSAIVAATGGACAAKQQSTFDGSGGKAGSTNSSSSSSGTNGTGGDGGDGGG